MIITVRRCALALILLAAVAALAWPAGPAAAAAGGKGRVLCHLRDPRIDEASGIAPANRTPGVVFVQNDSGDTNRFFAVDLSTCATVATVRVPGARNVDWEDIATARDAAGTASVWLADIGDNDARRRSVQVYRVTEPRLGRGQHGEDIRSVRAVVWRLRYPDGPSDAESLAVAPGGRCYVVTKSVLGTSAVYRLPARPTGAKTHTLRRVGTIQFVPHGVANPFEVPGELTATGAAFSPNGALFAVRTYASAYVWRVDARPLSAVLRDAPTRIDLPWQQQGEGVAFAGADLLIDSEGRHTAIRAVPLPHRLAVVATQARTAADAAKAVTSATRQAPASGTASGTDTSRPGHRSVGGIVAGIVVLAVLIGTSVLLRRRGRRRFRRDDPDEPRE